MTEQTQPGPEAIEEPMPTPSDLATVADATVERPEANEATGEAKVIAKLRAEAAEARIRAKRADALQAQLVAAWAAVDGRLIDASDLAFDPDMLEDDGSLSRERVQAAITALLEAKPHLGRRRPSATVPQGPQPEATPVNLADILRARA